MRESELQSDRRARVVATRLHRPSVAAGAVTRERLLGRLDRGIDLQMTMLSAPAGYGKTVLASQWLESASHRSAWMSLDEGDSNLAAFVELLVAAIDTVAPKSLAGTRQLLGAPQPLAPLELQASLGSELETLPERVILVLDDYHRVSSKEVDGLVSGLLASPYERLHLMLLTRIDPTLPLSNLRAHGQLTELGATDLAFSEEETATMLENDPEIEATPDRASAVHRSTEGWPAGVRLTIEASRHRWSASEPTLAAALLDPPHARDFLLGEVLEAQPPEVRAQLLTSSVLDRFCAPLCDAIAATAAGQTDGLRGREFLDWLERADLFVVPLDDEHEWFRYHHLFQRMLQRQLAENHSTEGIRELHRRAAEWFSAQGLLEAAFQHALQGEDRTSAAGLAALHGQDLVNHEQWSRLRRFLASIPDDLVGTDPQLLILQAWLYGDGFAQFGRMVDLLDRVEALIEERPQEASDYARGSVAALRGLDAYVHGDGVEATQHAERAAQLIPSKHARTLAFSVVLEIVGLQKSGRIDQAVARARSAMRDDRFRSTAFPPWTWSLPYVWWLEADMERLRREGRELRRHGRASEPKMPDAIAHGEYFIGLANYEQNRLARAATHFTAVVDYPLLARPVGYLHSAFGLALCHLARGAESAALDVAGDAAEFAATTRSAYMRSVTEAFLAEVDLRLGRSGSAVRWLEAGDLTPDPVRWMLYQPETTFVKALLAAGDAQARERAEALIARSLELAERTRNRPMLVQMFGLRALLDQALGQEAEAQSALVRAVSVSQPGGAVRLLADLGPELAGVLNRLDVQGEKLAHVAAILAAIGNPSSAEEPDPGDLQAVGVIDLPGVDPLTERETDVLGLLERRYSNKEIAAELLIAPETVKKHSINLYRKLNVSGRREAVEKAQALGYLNGNPPTPPSNP